MSGIRSSRRLDVSFSRQDMGVQAQLLRMWNRSDNHLCAANRNQWIANTMINSAQHATHLLQTACIQDPNCAGFQAQWSSTTLCICHRHFGMMDEDNELTKPVTLTVEATSHVSGTVLVSGACCVRYGTWHFKNKGDLWTDTWPWGSINHQQNYLPTDTAKSYDQPVA
jgi:hypothetical protein